MKKNYCILILALVAVILSSCRDEPSYDRMQGSWESYYTVDVHGEGYIDGRDVVRYDFYRNGRGRYTYYDNYGPLYIDFNWDVTRRMLYINYDDGLRESLYYDYDRNGDLILSQKSNVYYYTAYRRVF